MAAYGFYLELQGINSQPLQGCYTLIDMSTIKHRVNLTISSDTRTLLQRIAKRDRTSVAATTLGLVQKALEIEEDILLRQFAKTREKKKGEFFSHASAWA